MLFRSDHDVGQPPENSIALRIGIHIADVINDGNAIYGRGINLAARVTSLAEPRETLVSAAVADELLDGYDCRIEDFGSRYVKNSIEPVHVYRVGGLGPGSNIPLGPASLENMLPTIAVMPLRINSDATGAFSAADLVGETVSFSLRRAKGLRVIAWASSRVLARTSFDAFSAKQGATLLDADWMVSGSFHQAGDKIVLTIEVAEKDPIAITPIGRYVGRVSDLLQAECAITTQIANDVVSAITSNSVLRVTKYALPTLHAHTLLLGAIGLMNKGARNQFERSRIVLEHLLERHPRMHVARPWLALWYVLQAHRGLVAERPFAELSGIGGRAALDQTSRCLDVRSDDAFALGVRGFTYYYLMRDVGRATELLEQALLRDPNEPLVCTLAAAVFTVNASRINESWRWAQSALSLSPLAPNICFMQEIAASVAREAGDFGTAFSLAKASLLRNAAQPHAWQVLAVASAQSGDLDTAREAGRRFCALHPTLRLSAYRATHLQLNLGSRLDVEVEAMRAAGIPD